jgi:hypothetical protein
MSFPLHKKFRLSCHLLFLFDQKRISPLYPFKGPEVRSSVSVPAVELGPEGAGHFPFIKIREKFA